MHDLLFLATTRAIPNKKNPNPNDKIVFLGDLGLGNVSMVCKRLVGHIGFGASQPTYA
jgi:hypothetical protein